MEAVSLALRDYRDGKNPDERKLKDNELATRLGVSPPALSKYLNCKQLINTEALIRLLTELGIAINYKHKEISARDKDARKERLPDQISFVFNDLARLEDTTDNVAVVTLERKPQQSEMTVHVRVEQSQAWGT